MEHNKLEKENLNPLSEKVGSVVEKKILILLFFCFFCWFFFIQKIGNWMEQELIRVIHFRIGLH